MEIPYPNLIWFLIGIALFFFEMFVPAFVLFFFAVGAWLTAAVNWLYPLSLAGQLAVFMVSSLVALFLLRGFIQNIFRGTRAAEYSDSLDTAPGATAEVLEPITPPAEGRIKFQGSFWRASCDEPVAAGETVTIVAQQGLVMKVKRVQVEIR